MTERQMVQRMNDDSKVSFLQKEHSAMLKSLHSEIFKLQKKCSEMTLQLSFNMPELVKDDTSVTERRLRNEISQIEHQRDAVLTSIQNKDQQIRDLQEKMSECEARYVSIIYEQANKVTALETELHTKLIRISDLEQRLRQIENTKKDRLPISSSSMTPIFEPSPPKHGIPVRHIRRDSGASSHCCDNTYTYSISSERTAIFDQSRSTHIPDPAPFLHCNTMDGKLKLASQLKASQPILPPIAATNESRLSRNSDSSTPPESHTFDQVSVVGISASTTGL